MIALEQSAAPSAPTISHHRYLGSSDVAAILGCDPFKTELDVWAEKTGRVENVQSTEMEAGNDHEPAVAAGYKRRVLRLQLARSVAYPGLGTLIGNDPRRAATPDALTEHVRYGVIGAELKYVGHGMASSWGPEDANEDGVPEHVLAQVHWMTLHLREKLGVKAPIAHVAADLGTDRRVYEVRIDDTLIESLLDIHADWWRAHVELDTMPLPGATDGATVAKLFPRAKRPKLDDTHVPHIVALATEYDVARAAEKAATETKDALGNQLRAAIGDALGYGGAWGKAVWREQTRSRTDWEALARALGATPEAIESATTRTLSRVLDVKLRAEE